MHLSTKGRALSKLPARYAGILIPLLLTGVMTGVISGIATLRALGVTPEMPALWCEAWIMSWGVAFPLMTFLLPLVRRLVRLFVRDHE